jgi:hypothetical protein
MTLTDLANRYGTDKGTLAGAGHGYTLVYDLLFRSFQNRPLNFLEIGLSAGGPEVDGPIKRNPTSLPSVSMWHDFFPQAMIYGLDISDFSDFETSWFKFFRADCGRREELKRVADTGVQFDIIIDDGSHASYHQQLTLEMLFPTLKPGGLYAIEDLNWQPATYEAKLPKVAKTTDFLRDTDYGTTLSFSEDELVTLRKNFNERAGLRASMPHYLDTFNLRGYARRVGETALNGIRTLCGRQGVKPRIKLAVIQKLQ